MNKVDLLSYEFIKDTLEAIEEEKAGLLVPYKIER